MLLASSEAIREAEQALFASGACSSVELMDTVVGRLYPALEAHLGAEWHPARIVAYVGRGNNAGDAVGLAAHYNCPLLLRGCNTADELSPDTQEQLARARRVEFSPTAPDTAPRTLILDGLLGSGSRGPLRPETAALVREMNALREACPQSLTLAIDIPTGLLAGGADCVVADITCPIGCVKPTMLADGAEDAVGQMLPIPLPEVDITPCNGDLLMDAALLRAWLPRRTASCFKNRAGRVVIIAGSEGMLGAAHMCAEAALAAGAGLVTLYARPDTFALLATRVAPEIMVRRVSSYAEVDTAGAQALLIGPGLGNPGEKERAALRTLAEGFAGTVVLDADALNAAAEQHWELGSHANWVLTPHPGEMRRLAPQLATLPRREQVARFLEHTNATLVLKGSRSLSATREQCYYNGTGGPFMANGGQGDVLAGAIAALASQGLPPLHAAAAGAHACGHAATIAWQRLGYPRAIRATQTLSHLPHALS